MADGVESVEQLAGVAVAALDRAVAKGVLHRNNAARRKSRLMKRLQTAEQAPAPTPAPAKTSTRSAASSSRSSRSKTAGQR